MLFVLNVPRIQNNLPQQKLATWVQRGSTSNVTFVANDGAGTRFRAEPAYSATTSFPGGSTLSHSANVTYAVFATGTED